MNTNLSNYGYSIDVNDSRNTCHTCLSNGSITNYTRDKIDQLNDKIGYVDDVTENDVRNNNTVGDDTLCHENYSPLTNVNNNGIIASECESVNNQKQPEMISVNRSYAKGNSTFSVAKRSPSPFSNSRKPMTNSNLSQSHFNMCRFPNNEGYDVSTIQNINNERILSRMKRNTQWCTRLWDRIHSAVNITNVDDYLSELCLCICGATFLALCLDIKPLSYVLLIVLAMVIKLLLSNLLHCT